MDPASAEYITFEMVMISETLVGGLIGRNGSNISRIRNESGAMVKVYGGKGEQKHRQVQFCGSAHQNSCNICNNNRRNATRGGQYPSYCTFDEMLWIGEVYGEDEAGNSDLVLRLLQSPLQNQSMLTANPRCFISEFMNAGQAFGLPMLSATVMYHISKLSTIYSTLFCNEMCVAIYLKTEKRRDVISTHHFLLLSHLFNFQPSDWMN
ncbi:uncharacterized protein [Malus domestica]|uniref:uncharacterized protein isoform X2 n=2 Tax=Malus domestica TaxID=3750 RepID=UPI003975A76E